MMRGVLLLVCAICLSGRAGASASDVVNERIPISRIELEQHWKIDCAELVRQYNGAVAQRFAHVDGGTLAHLIREATLCSYVYNVTATGAPAAACPDYTAVSAVLQALRQLRSEGRDPGAWEASPVQCE